MRIPAFLVAACALLLAACASFPAPPRSAAFDDGLSAEQVVARSLAAHGGDVRDWPGDINLATDGRWYELIQRIQPIVSDATFRVRSEERYRPSDGIYAVQHTGPAGTKQVVRTREGVSVHYNGERADATRARATAMTNDAFRFFHFGPSFIAGRATAMVRMPDAREDGRRFQRVHATLEPGFGEAARDEAVLWFDASTSLLFRVHMTLNGFETTQGAHVDTTFLAYRKVGPFVLPVKFAERVRGPVRIKAHDWEVTGIDLDRGWRLEDVVGPAFSGAAARPAID